MNAACERAMRFTIPAVRAAVSETLSKDYGMKETQIAKKLGIAQAAVSKYVGHKYSKRIGLIRELIQSRGLEVQIVKSIMANAENEKVLGLVDSVASNDYVVQNALKF